MDASPMTVLLTPTPHAPAEPARDADVLLASPAPVARPGAPSRACAGRAASDDVTLMRRLRNGELAAFEALYDRHAPAALALARRMLGDRAAAEDVTQEAFITLWRSATTYAPELSAPRSWLLAITRNRAIDALRRRRDVQPLGAEHHEREAPERTDEAVWRRAEAATIQAALHTLPSAQRRVLELAFYSELSQSEIASTLDLPLGTVKGRMRLALKKLGERVDAPALALA
jgi:RNA polymerase sigma-70 factor (ECF subfamily)